VKTGVILNIQNRYQFLIVGLGIGSVYVDELSKDHLVETIDVDPKKNPSYNSIDDFLKRSLLLYDAIIICTPTFLHKEQVLHLKNKSSVFFVEKPGFKNWSEWNEVRNELELEGKRLILVKNNLFRPQNRVLFDLCQNINLEAVNLKWITKNRIPWPGSWFTDIEKAYGGVTYDLLPHMLSFLLAMTFPGQVKLCQKTKKQYWKLDTITRTDYGKINKKGIYNVDDWCNYKFVDERSIVFNIKIDWASEYIESQEIQFVFKDGSKFTYEFGLCPNYVYGVMVLKTLQNIESVYNDERSRDDFIIKTISEE
jgi:predicted dehydrogenase